MKKILSLILVLALSAALFVGCAAPVQNASSIRSAASVETVPAQTEPETQPVQQPEVMTGGVLCLKINPEIALHYDENGKVTKLEGRNADGAQLLKDFAGYEGKETSQVLEELVAAIGKAGYFVEEAEGKARKIVLELDPGSQVPHEQFLEDMAAHVKLCVENKNWIGEAEYEYDRVTAPTEAAAKPTAPKQTTASSGTTGSTVPTGLCPICADDDCDDGKYCDDAREKAENLREYERLMSGQVCAICGDYDCDDGKYCDDADEKAENLREAEVKKERLASSGNATSSGSDTSSGKTDSSPGVPSGLCSICADDDCDDGKYCDDADEKAENLREAENRKNGTPCSVCGDYDCDDGKYCDDWDDRYDDHHDD